MMTATENRGLTTKARSAKDRLALARFTDERRVRLADKQTPEDHQERLEPTYPVMVALANTAQGRREVAKCRRRRSAKFWDELTIEQEIAVDRIEMAHRIMVGPMRTASMLYDERKDRGGSAEEYSVFINRCLADYILWGRLLREKGFAEKVVYAVIFDGCTLRDAEAIAKRRNGWARQHILAALDLHGEAREQNRKRQQKAA